MSVDSIQSKMNPSTKDNDLSSDDLFRLADLYFYKRNYIEGLFLSSGIIRSADYTMELVIEVARKLREEHQFRGYIHLKTIPEASQALIALAGRYADRISINVELPSQQSLDTLAPEKNLARTEEAMGHIREKIDERHAEKRGPDTPKPGGCRCLDRRGDPRMRGQALYGSSPAKSLLFRIQSDSGTVRNSSAQGTSAHSRAPALSGRLAAAVLRFQG